MRAALAYQAVVGWIDMVLTIAAWPLNFGCAIGHGLPRAGSCGPAAVLPVAGAGLRNSPAYLTRR